MHDPTIWLAAVATCGAVAIWGHTPGRMPIHWGFKPLPALLLLLAVLSFSPTGPTRAFLVAGLIFSLLGDLILMMPPRWFAVGLASFLIALLCYAIGFSVGVERALWHVPILLLPLAPAAWVQQRLWPHLSARLRPAVLVYVGAMTLLLWRLLVRFDGPANLASCAVALAGGTAFMVADSLLALRRFAGWRVPYPLELGLYYVAQACLATSTWI
jgi:uncharacterized membrane protein YhhN